MASACIAASWTASLPYPASRHQQYQQTPLRPSTATWNTKFPPGLNLDLSLPAATPKRTPIGMTRYAPSTSSTELYPGPQKPRLRLATPTSSAPPPSVEPTRRFDPFAEDDAPVASSSQNTPPPSRGRPLTPLAITVPAPAPAVEGGRVGRRRAPSFSAGTPRPSAPLSTLSALSCAPSPAPSLARARSPPTDVVGSVSAPPVPMAPTPFHARHYPTSDARARLLARTLLNRIHAVGRPRSMYSCGSSSSPYSRTSMGGCRVGNGYESECGGRGYVPSRLSECVVAAC
ncbi:hypothetical protein C8F04DRAFT_1077510 [Mycena alexandri]|uniref:Uncharacterized protein n=1 Tax=Mycena alexandri TaxID=1745969 RepID=A0AAD6TDB7_9AGAR|nr:hypothetical protein C8F04DRAFT_1077510 [Mycena alexandri]